MAFRIVGLDPGEFRSLFSLSDEELADRNITRVVANEKPGFPCRVTLRDAEPGESLLLLNYEHQPAASPYRSSHAIFVIENAQKRFDEVDRVPEVMKVRLLSVRAFDAKGNIVDADVMEGGELEAAIPRFFQNERTEYLHVHYAKRGCFSARVDRVR